MRQTNLNSLFWKTTALLLALATALAGAGCRKKQAGGGGPQAPAMEVVIEKPTPETVEDLITAVGTLEPNERVDLKPEASGTVTFIWKSEGQAVKKGEKLLELNLEKETALVEQRKVEEKLARANLDRAKSLAGTKAISQQEVEDLESQIAVRIATRKVDEQRLSERTILAPFDGLVGPRLASVGQWVASGTSVGALVDASRVKVRFQVPERQIALLRVGQEGRIRVSAFTNSFSGQIDLIHPEVDEKTRTVEVRMLVPNPARLLKPGMFAQTEVVVGRRPGAQVIPEGALIPQLDRFSVYRVENGSALLRSVVLGVRMKGRVEVREGLSSEDEIVVSGTSKLVEGMKVVPAKSASAGEGNH